MCPIKARVQSSFDKSAIPQPLAMTATERSPNLLKIGIDIGITGSDSDSDYGHGSDSGSGCTHWDYTVFCSNTFLLAHKYITVSV